MIIKINDYKNNKNKYKKIIKKNKHIKKIKIIKK